MLRQRHGVQWSTALQSEGIGLKVGDDHVQFPWKTGSDWIQTYEVTGAPETASGTAKIDGSPNRGRDSTRTLLASGGITRPHQGLVQMTAQNDLNTAPYTFKWQDIPLLMQT